MEKDDDNSRLMAGLCYVPFMLIDVIAILYILFAKKGGPYAKYHALQGLSVFILVSMVSMVFMLAFMFPLMQNMAQTQAQFIQSANNSSVRAAQSLQFMTGMYSAMLPMFGVTFAMLFIQLALAVLVAMGKDIRVPVLRGFLEKLV